MLTPTRSEFEAFPPTLQRKVRFSLCPLSFFPRVDPELGHLGSWPTLAFQ